MRSRVFAERYELVSLLGQGGVARVWRAVDTRLARTVAVKVLDRPGLFDGTAVERFRREALTLAGLAHPNIVAVYDFGEQDGQSYLVMELVDGATLAERLRAGPLPVTDAVRVAAQACAALGAAHRAGVVHRDVKPSNLIITAGGQVKMLDFGIARLHNVDATGARLTRAATVIGTSHYLAPEQITGAPAEPRSDLYALGCVLREMLTGSPPFVGEDPMSVLYQHMHHDPTPTRQLRPDVPDALDQLVTALLAKHPDQRPQSAEQTRERLLAAGITAEALGPALGQPTSTAGHAARTDGLAATRTMPTSIAPTESGLPARSGSGAVTGRAAMPATDQTRIQPVPAARSLPRWTWPVAAGAVLLVTLLCAAGFLMPDKKAPSGASTPTHSPTATDSPTATPAPTDPAGQLAAIRALVDRHTARGGISDKANHKINEELDKIAEDLAKRELDKAAEHTAELSTKLDELRREGALDTTAHTALDRAVADLAATLPDRGKDAGDKNDKDHKEDKEGEEGRGKGNKDSKGGGNGTDGHN